jgi:hypothetical protein
MTGTELQTIFQSDEFTQGLTDISSCLASITQERPIVFLLAKCLWNAGYKLGKFALEDKKVDLSLYTDGAAEPSCRIEVKFNFGKYEKQLARELVKHGNDLHEMWNRKQAKQIAGDFLQVARIYEDLCIKKPDIFVWVICSRDLSKLPSADLERICGGTSKHNQYVPRDQPLTVIDPFLETLKESQHFKLRKLGIDTNGEWFPCTYHFRICEISRVATCSTNGDGALRRKAP